MLYVETIAVCSQIHTKHINTLCGLNVGIVNVKLMVHKITTVPWSQISRPTRANVDISNCRQQFLRETCPRMRSVANRRTERCVGLRAASQVAAYTTQRHENSDMAFWARQTASRDCRYTVDGTNRVRIYYRRILQNHIFTNSEQKYIMLLPFERGRFAVVTTASKLPSERALNRHKTVKSRKFQDTLGR
jgi:hypothetical protein